jgi:hypothetical protein
MRAVVRPDEQLPERANIKNYCQKIIRTILIFFHPAVGTFRTHLVVFSLSIAMSHLISVWARRERGGAAISGQLFLEAGRCNDWKVLEKIRT